MKRSLWPLCLALGCYEPSVYQPAPMPAHHWSAGDQVEDRGPATLHPNELVYGKMPRRLRVEQLRRSIPLLFDGITWTDAQGNNRFETMVAALGEADYEERYRDETTPSPLFAKFMDDMAGQVCSKAINRDARQADPARRLLTPYGDEVFRNLRFLRLKLHGLHVPEDRNEDLQALHQLYSSIRTELSPMDAWRGVCVAMVTAPEFMAY